MSKTAATACVLGLFGFVYFVIYPDDIATLVAPVGTLADALATAVAEPAGKLLKLSEAISPWLYGTAIAGLAAWTASRIWGKTTAAAKRKPAARAK